jgi:hypothetical protein
MYDDFNAINAAFNDGNFEFLFLKEMILKCRKPYESTQNSQLICNPYRGTVVTVVTTSTGPQTVVKRYSICYLWQYLLGPIHGRVVRTGTGTWYSL